MLPTRIVLVDLPRMLREIIADAVVREPDMSLAGHVADGDDLLATIDETDADVVIVGAEGFPAREVRRLLGVRPTLKVLLVTGDGREAALYELRPHEEPLGELSPRTLVAAIRTAVQRDRVDAESERHLT